MEMMKFVDMKRSPKDYQTGALVADCPSPDLYPYGLCIRLNQEDLDKLNLDDDVESGDMVHLHAMAKVTCVSKRDTTTGKTVDVELQITHLSVEDEDDENEETEEGMDENPAKLGRKNPYR